MNRDSMLAGKKIALLILQHFSNAPRAQKESHALSKAGAEVIVFGSWWNPERRQEDLDLAERLGIEFVPLFDVHGQNRRRNVFARVTARVARELYARSGLVLPEAYGITARLMVRAVKNFKPDLTMVHCEPGLWAGRQLMKGGGLVGIDFEDWFSEDLLPEARVHRPVEAIARAERHYLSDGAVRFATTCSMAEALKVWSGAASSPIVIPNCFPWSDAPESDGGGDTRTAQALSMYWFSQTIGPGRGLEALAKVLTELEGNWEVHLRGNLGMNERWFEETFPLAIRNRIILREPVSNDRLPLLSSAHDLGLALEIPFCPSRDLTATNKIFEYLRCGLAVIATNTAGQREVMRECPGAGWMVSAGDLKELAAILQHCINHPEEVRAAKMAARHAASTAWAWENYEHRIVSEIFRALSI